MPNELTLTGKVKIAGINPYVDVPRRVVEALPAGSNAAVLVKVASAHTKKSNTLAERNVQKTLARLVSQ